MSNFLRNIVRVNAIKGFNMSQTMGIRAGTRSLWHMSKSATPITMKHNKCSGIVGCNCGCGVRFASTNGKFQLFFYLPHFKIGVSFREAENITYEFSFAPFRWKSIGWVFARRNCRRKGKFSRTLAITIGRFPNQIRLCWSWAHQTI